MTAPIEVLFTKLHSEAQAPQRGSALAAGWDLRSIEEQTVYKGKTTRIPTGLAVAIPAGFEGQVRARSSLGAKGMILPNGVGTIDADYRGEIQVLATWIGEGDSFTVEAGERIAQLVIAPIPSVEFIEVKPDELGDTKRGTGGFGSTGRY